MGDATTRISTPPNTVHRSAVHLCPSTPLSPSLDPHHHAQGEQYCYKDSLRIRDFYLDDKCNRSEARWSHSWHLVHKERKTVYQLFAKTEEMKRIWIKAIEEAL